MFCSNEHYMSILHMAIFMYMATQHFDPAKNAIQGDAPEGSDTF